MNYLKANQLPALLTALLAIFSWLILTTIDKAEKIPLIKYTIEEHSGLIESTAMYRVENINSDKGFSDIDFFITPSDPDTIMAAQLDLPPPIKLNTSQDFFEKNKKYVKFHLTSFQPKNAFRITLHKTGKEIPDLRYRSSSFFVLSQKSFQTIIKDNEFPILFFLIVVCIAVIIVYFIRVKTP